MRILFVNYEYPPLGGGGGIETRDLAEELAKRHDVHVLTTAYADLPSTERSNGVTIHRVRVWGRTKLPTASLRSMVTFVPAALWAGVRLLRTMQPDVLNAHFVVPSGIPALALARIGRVPFVLTLIGGDIYDPSKGVSPHRHAILRWIVSRIVRRADAVTAISQDTRERALRYHRAEAPITVVPLGLVPPAAPLEVKQSPDTVGARIDLITVGRLIPRKGYADLLLAIASMHEKNIFLHILGDGPLASELQREAATRGVLDRVQFHGHVSEAEKFRLLAASDVYVSASHHEGFGICFLEAMYAGLPIIATDTGGQTDFLTAGRNAILVPPHHPKELGRALEALILDRSVRERMAATNREDVQQYVIGRTAAQYEEIFQRVSHSRV